MKKNYGMRFLAPITACSILFSSCKKYFEDSGLKSTEPLPINSLEYMQTSSNANELIFNAGTDEIKPGRYRIVVRVSNSSGSLILKDDLVLKVNAYAPTFLQLSAVTAGSDGITSSVVEMVKTGEGNSLKVFIIEKDGTSIPLDSLTASSTANSFNSIQAFNK